MKLKQLVTMMITAGYIVAMASSLSYAVITGYSGKVDRAKTKEQQRLQNQGKPVPGFQTATPQQQQEQAKESMKKKLAEEQKKNDEKAKKAIIDMKTKDAQQRGIDTKLKDYKAK